MGGLSWWGLVVGDDTVGLSGRLPEQPGEAKQGLDEREEAVVQAELAPGRVADQIGMGDAQRADDQDADGLDRQRAHRDAPGRSRSLEKTDGSDDVESSGESGQGRCQSVGDAFLEEQLVDAAGAGRKRQQGVGDA